MNIRNYMKKNNINIEDCENKVSIYSAATKILQSHGFIITLSTVCIAVFAIAMFSSIKTTEHVPTISLISSPLAETAAKKETISVPVGIVKAHPFLPYRNIDGADSVGDVPMYDLVAPPEVLNEGSDAARIMDTIVSGILYDKFSPSAILNIEGNDYLVKKGDIVNNYKVLDIAKDSVTVKLGSNTFKAGIGEILTEGSVNYNDVSNLNRKFGGEK